MANAYVRRLKVFQAQFGFYDSVVAAPSQTAALLAWGTRQNLFASGDAQQISDAGVVAAALEHPEIPLRRAVGSTDPFQLEPAHLPKIPDAPMRRAAKVVAKATDPAPVRPPVSRKALDDAEEALRALELMRLSKEAHFRKRQEELDAAKTQAQSDYVAAQKAATAAIVQARQAYRAAGGTG